MLLPVVKTNLPWASGFAQVLRYFKLNFLGLQLCAELLDVETRPSKCSAHRSSVGRDEHHVGKLNTSTFYIPCKLSIIEFDICTREKCYQLSAALLALFRSKSD